MVETLLHFQVLVERIHLKDRQTTGQLLAIDQHGDGTAPTSMRTFSQPMSWRVVSFSGHHELEMYKYLPIVL